VRALVNGETVNYRQHIGGAHYISVTTGFRCVEFYMPYGQKDIKPTLKGVALRLQEWGEMRKVMESIDNDNPSLATAVPCYLQDDHQNQLGSVECKECNPRGKGVLGKEKREGREGKREGEKEEGGGKGRGGGVCVIGVRGIDAPDSRWGLA